MKHHIDLVNRWSQSATQNSEHAQQAREEVLFSLNHLRQPKACLHRLDLSGLNLTTLPPLAIWQQLEGTAILDLSNNDLPGTELEKLSGLRSLQQLYVSHNPLQQIPAVPLICQENMAILKAENCMLHEFPVGVMDLYQLDTLNLKGNPLPSLPDHIGHYLPQLFDLDIRDTGITQLPESLDYLKHLVIRK